MPRVYVLDVPEFAGLVTSARADSEKRVIDTGKGYIIIEHDTHLIFERRAAGFKPAVWYGAFTGGIEGEITDFGRDSVRIENRRTAQ